MASTMRVPTVFTAVDNFTSVVTKMTSGVSNFSKASSSAVMRVNTKVNSLWNSLDGIGQLAFGGGIAAGFGFASKAVMDYENSLASFRTIVSDLSDKDFKKYQNAIGLVANDTKKSSIDVAKSFEKIAGLNSDFAKTETGLAAISKASIILSKASGDDLGVSAENLVGIMNQFSMGANEANRAINVLAAGQAVGASTITQSAEAYKNFGSVAKGANITLEESQALIQTLGKYSIFGAEAGTKLRGATLQLQKAGIGYASGQFNINDALLEASKMTDKLKTSREKDAFILKIFGAENISVGKILLKNIQTYQDYTKGVTNTTEAQKAAEINTATLSSKFEELKASFVNLITTNDKTNSILLVTKKIIGFLADNMSTILTSIGVLIGLFIGFKAIVLAVTIATGAYNIALGIMGGLSGSASIAIGQSTLALNAYRIASSLASAAQWVLNTSIMGFPLVWIIAGITALIGLIYVIIAKWNEWGAALSVFLGPLGFVISLVQSFRDNWEMVKESFATGGILDGLLAIGKVILNAVLMPVQQLLELLSKIPGVGDIAKGAADKIKALRLEMGTLEAPETKQVKATANATVNGQVNVNVSAKNGAVANTQSKSIGGIPVKTTNTQGAF